jgi:hypothetical protein
VGPVGPMTAGFGVGVGGICSVGDAVAVAVADADGTGVALYTAGASEDVFGRLVGAALGFGLSRVDAIVGATVKVATEGANVGSDGGTASIAN